MLPLFFPRLVRARLHQAQPLLYIPIKASFLRLEPELDQAVDGFSQSVFRFVIAFGSSVLIGSPIILGPAFAY